MIRLISQSVTHLGEAKSQRWGCTINIITIKHIPYHLHRYLFPMHIRAPSCIQTKTWIYILLQLCDVMRLLLLIQLFKFSVTLLHWHVTRLYYMHACFNKTKKSERVMNVFEEDCLTRHVTLSKQLLGLLALHHTFIYLKPSISFCLKKTLFLLTT